MVLPAISKPFRSALKSPSATTNPSASSSSSSGRSSSSSSNSNSNSNKDGCLAHIPLDAPQPFNALLHQQQLAIQFNIFDHIDNLRRSRLHLQSQQQGSHRKDVANRDLHTYYNHSKPTSTSSLQYCRSCNGRDRIPYWNHEEDARTRSKSSELRVSTVMAISTTNSSSGSGRMDARGDGRACNNCCHSQQVMTSSEELSVARTCRERKMASFFVCGRPSASDE